MVAVDCDIYVWNRTGRYCKAISVRLDGSIEYSEMDKDGDTASEIEGTYVIDTNNKIHITWNNGFVESAKLSYISYEKRGVIEYNGIIFQEVLDTDD